MHIDFSNGCQNDWKLQIPGDGKRRSPFELFFHKSRHGSIAPKPIHSYDVPLSKPIIVTNNGHMVKVAIGSSIGGLHSAISGEALNDHSVVDNIHFHWGSARRKGLEHKITDEKLDLEMHILHRSVKNKSEEEVLEEPPSSIANKKMDLVETNEIKVIEPISTHHQHHYSTDESKKHITMESLIGNHGWGLHHKNDGKKQSPIELYFHKSLYGNIDPLSFHSYDVPLSQPVVVSNIGHTVNVAIGSTINGDLPAISGGGLKDRYVVDNIHFHWGAPKKNGTEHKISGKKFDLEMHVVHRNEKYKNLHEALSDPVGLAAFGVLFKAVKKSKMNRFGINEIFDILPNLSKYNSKEEIRKNITMQSIIGGLKTKQYFTYSGSLTSPPYTEAVKWFVFPNPVPIRADDLKKFFTLYDKQNIPMLNNCRPLQKVRCQKVCFRKNISALQWIYA